MRIIFFGTPQFSADILSAILSDSEITVTAVVCQQDEPVGRKKILTPPPTKQLALSKNIPVFQPTRLKDEAFLSAIDELKADVAVIVAYGRILPKVLIDRIPKGFVNLHPSLLPKYRGPSPMQAAIAAGDSQTGVSIMTIDEGMDTGPLLAQQSIELTKDETTTSLTQKVVALGAPMLIAALKGYMDGSITPKPQPSEGVSICKLLSRENGKINWTESAATIEQKIRAYTPWPGTWTTWTLNGTETIVKILQAVPAPNAPKTTDIGTPFEFEGKLFCTALNIPLEITKLQPAGGKPMDGSDFARGYLKN
ncbi:MAG: methionyl-tRNA formyltransferase [Patescibacteria group bacterium]|jgi:methionyl-tRNA formyltransferase